MVITLTGTNNFLLKAELRRLVDGFVAEHTDMGLERLDGEEVEYDRMREALESLPFLAPRKLVVLLGPSTNKQFTENAERLLSNLPEITDVIIVEPKLDKRLGYTKYLQKHTEYKSFEELDENGLSRWLVEQATTAGGSLGLGDARYLVERAGGQQQKLAQELKKLLMYSPQITRQTIDLLTEPTPHSTTFDLLDAAFSGKRARVMQLYDEQRQAKVEPQQILALVAWQLHVLAVIKAAGGRDAGAVAKEARLNPFVVRKSQAVARNLSGPRLKQLIHEALVLDTRLKSEPLDADDALRHYLMRLGT
jgi:DNA polymerase III subunit delta